MAGPSRLCTEASRLFTNHQFLRGGTVPPRHKRVPPFHKPPVFTRRDGTASAQTRPAFPQTTSFYEAGRSRLVSPVHKQSVKTVVVRSRLSPPVFKHLVKTVVGRSRLSHPIVTASLLRRNQAEPARVSGRLLGPHQFPGKVMQHSRLARIPGSYA